MLEMPGQPALSDFRLAKLTRALQRKNDRVKTVQARFSYFVELAEPLSQLQHQRLKALLLSGDKPGNLSATATKVTVIPRPGTISPWSSKATDIALACDLGSVRRIERGICFGLQLKGQIAQEDLQVLKAELFDRMTEAALDISDAVFSFCV